MPAKYACLATLHTNKQTGETEIRFFKELGEDNLEKWQKALNLLEELTASERLLQFVMHNEQQLIDELTHAAEMLTKKSDSWHGVTRANISEVYVIVNRCFLNYLSSVRTFIDHTDSYLNRKFGKQSEEFREFKGELSRQFDTCFAYRFFYKLRNFAQHVGLPISSVSFTTRADRVENCIKTSLTPTFNSLQLLKDYKEWGPAKFDLQKQPEEFPAIPLLFEMSSSVESIGRFVKVLIKKELYDAAFMINEETSELTEENFDVVLVDQFFENEDGSLARFSQRDIPLDLVCEILDSLKE
ncbi:hypothetical protein [Dyadobacter sp. 22481]|uniref:hypothetical protein n=1 Tax=Dyadobacter sp. 22481 TaxID=3453926 RepID=UPI003F846137